MNPLSAEDDFHIIAHIAYFVSMLDGKEQDARHVKRLAYEMFENRKKTGKLFFKECGK